MGIAIEFDNRSDANAYSAFRLAALSYICYY